MDILFLITLFAEIVRLHKQTKFPYAFDFWFICHVIWIIIKWEASIEWTIIFMEKCLCHLSIIIVVNKSFYPEQDWHSYNLFQCHIFKCFPLFLQKIDNDAANTPSGCCSIEAEKARKLEKLWLSRATTKVDTASVGTALPTTCTVSASDHELQELDCDSSNISGFYLKQRWNASTIHRMKISIRFTIWDELIWR